MWLPDLVCLILLQTLLGMRAHQKCHASVFSSDPHLGMPKLRAHVQQAMARQLLLAHPSAGCLQLAAKACRHL